MFCQFIKRNDLEFLMVNKKEKQDTEFIELLLNFLKRDVEKINYNDVSAVGLEYLQFLYYNRKSKELSNYKMKYDIFTSVSLDRSGEKLNEIKKHLESVQSHLRESLINLVEKTPPVTLRQKGTRVISVVDDKFIETFETKEVPLDSLDDKTEKQKAEALLLDCLINEPLEPSKFKRCEKCDSFLYQGPRGRKKKFCSDNCSSVGRQKKKRDKDKKKKQNNSPNLVE